MKVETTPLENRILKVVVEATPEETEAARRAAAVKLGKRVQVAGFRPGKAPLPILMKHIDPIRLQEETIDTFLDRYYVEILEQEAIEPSDRGELQEIHNIDPLILEIHIPLKPLVELGDYHSIRIPYEPPTVSDEDVEKALENLREQHAIYEPIERRIQEGDFVHVDMIGYEIENGEKTDRVVLQKNEFSIVVRRVKEGNEEFEFPFGGFGERLIDKQNRDDFSVTYKYPKDYYISQFRGKEIQFEGTIRETKTKVPPDLNDEFAQSIGEYASLEDLKQQVRSALEEDVLDQYHEEYEAKVLDEVIANSTIEYSPKLLDKEREAFLERFKSRLSEMNLDIDLYKKIRRFTDEEFEQEITKAAESRLKISLVLIEIAKRENISLDLVSVRDNTRQSVLELLQSSNVKRIPNKVLDDITYTLSVNTMLDQVMEKAAEKLRNIARGVVHEELNDNQEVDSPETNLTSSQENPEQTQASEETTGQDDETRLNEKS